MNNDLLTFMVLSFSLGQNVLKLFVFKGFVGYCHHHHHHHD